MTLIAQRLSSELLSISQANQASQITRDEAEYLIQTRYQVAMMQHEVLIALHDSLQHELAHAAQRPRRGSHPDAPVVVPPRPTGSNSIRWYCRRKFYDINFFFLDFLHADRTP